MKEISMKLYLTEDCNTPDSENSCTRCNGRGTISAENIIGDPEWEICPACCGSKTTSSEKRIENIVCRTGVEVKLTPVVDDRGYLSISKFDELARDKIYSQMGTQLIREEMIRLRDALNLLLEQSSSVSLTLREYNDCLENAAKVADEYTGIAGHQVIAAAIRRLQHLPCVRCGKNGPAKYERDDGRVCSAECLDVLITNLSSQSCTGCGLLENEIDPYKECSSYGTAGHHLIDEPITKFVLAPNGNETVMNPPPASEKLKKLMTGKKKMTREEALAWSHEDPFIGDPDALSVFSWTDSNRNSGVLGCPNCDTPDARCVRDHCNSCCFCNRIISPPPIWLFF